MSLGVLIEGYLIRANSCSFSQWLMVCWFCSQNTCPVNFSYVTFK